jgi:hypothetical protein
MWSESFRLRPGFEFTALATIPLFLENGHRRNNYSDSERSRGLRRCVCLIPLAMADEVLANGRPMNGTFLYRIHVFCTSPNGNVPGMRGGFLFASTCSNRVVSTITRPTVQFSSPLKRILSIALDSSSSPFSSARFVRVAYAHIDQDTTAAS